jgi:iron-sulfur cluster assembly accessory protein
MFSVTEKAATKLKSFLVDNPGFFAKVAVTSGGCSGFKYHIGLDATRSENDTTFSTGFDLDIVIPEDSLPYLASVTLDYQQSFMSEGFSFSNPEAQSCGCGSSFRPKESEACD